MSNQLTAKKWITFTKFLQENCESKFMQFLRCAPCPLFVFYGIGILLLYVFSIQRRRRWQILTFLIIPLGKRYIPTKQKVLHYESWAYYARGRLFSVKTNWIVLRHVNRILLWEIRTKDTKWFCLSVRNTANVLPLTLGYHNPLAFIIVRMWRLSAFNSLSKTLGEPHLATWAKPLEARPPYSQTL